VCVWFVALGARRAKHRSLRVCVLCVLHMCMCVYVCAACACMCVCLCCVCNSANDQCISCQGVQSIASGFVFVRVACVCKCVYVCACVFVCVPASLLLTTARRVFSSVCVFVCGWLLSRAGRWHQVCDGLWWAVQLSQRVVRILPRHAWHRFVCVCVCVVCVCVCVFVRASARARPSTAGLRACCPQR
jgi:hypothetical protein